jgi:hypothetical protein
MRRSTRDDLRWAGRWIFNAAAVISLYAFVVLVQFAGAMHDFQIHIGNLASRLFGRAPPMPSEVDILGVPAWAAISLSLVLPMALLLMEVFALCRGKRKQGNPLCRHCHYDLTGNVSGVCPECGTIVAKKME